MFLSVLKISLGYLETIAGSSTSGFADGSPGSFDTPRGLAIISGQAYVCDYSNSEIRKVDTSGVVSTFAGLTTSKGNDDGIGTSAAIKGPSTVVADKTNSFLYIADQDGNRIRKLIISTRECFDIRS